MSKIYKAPNVQLEKENFRIDYTPALNFNQNIEPFEEIDDEMNFGIPDFDVKLKQSVKNEDEHISELKIQADEILENARIEAEGIIEAARIEAENAKVDIFEESRTDGYNEGYSKGIAEGTEEMNSKLDSEMKNIESRKEEIENERVDMFKDLEFQAVEVISDVLENLIRTAFDIDKSLITQLVKIGLLNTSISSDVNIKVSTDIYEIVNEQIDNIYKSVESNIVINLISDKSLNDSECIIDTELGFVKCDVDSIIESLKFNLQVIYSNTK